MILLILLVGRLFHGLKCGYIIIIQSSICSLNHEEDTKKIINWLSVSWLRQHFKRIIIYIKLQFKPWLNGLLHSLHIKHIFIIIIKYIQISFWIYKNIFVNKFNPLILYSFNILININFIMIL